MWVLMNHYRDEDEEFQKTKLLCKFINPAAASELFDQKDVVKTESTDDVMFENMSKDLKGKYTPEELRQMMEDPEHYQNLDKIERVD